MDGSQYGEYSGSDVGTEALERGVWNIDARAPRAGARESPGGTEILSSAEVSPGQVASWNCATIIPAMTGRSRSPMLLRQTPA